VITPRHTRLVRVPDLHALHRAIARYACRGPVADIRSTAVLVSTHAAAEQLRRTLENLVLLADGKETASRHADVAVWPEILTREGWYERLHHASAGASRVLSAIEREVLMARAAREAIAAGHAPPFHVRPALVAEMLEFLDTMVRLGRTLDAFERLLVEELEPRVTIDRGAERLLRQTRFLVASFRRYRELVAASAGCDEHGLRERLLREDGRPPFTRIVVTVGDRSGGRDGLWPVDFDLLARLPHVERIDILATGNVLAAGFHERLLDLLPGIEEVDFGQPAAAAGRVPVLITPAGSETPWWVHRDREEEIASIARRLKRDTRRRGLDRVAIVCKRPLPYVYLAQSYLGAAGIPFQAFDDLPLAAEPFAAAVDLIFRLVESGFGRRQAIALLRSPHFLFVGDEGEVPREAVSALEGALREAGCDADADTLDRLAERWSAPEATSAQRAALRAARVIAPVARQLAPLGRTQAAASHFDVLLAFLGDHARPGDGSAIAARTARARAAVLGALRELAAAHRLHDDPPLGFDDFVSRIRRWMEAQTFAPRTGSGGVQLVDAGAARYGDFDDVHLVGVVEREWPDKEGRTIFYPLALLNQLGWPPERLRLATARAAFRDLVRLAAARVSVSAFVLEDDALVEPSPFLDEIERSGLEVDAVEPPRDLRIVPEDALSREPVRADVLSSAAREWAELRQARSSFDEGRFHGSVSPAPPESFAVRRLEMYLECPFKYFAEAVLGLKDESDDDPAEGPRAQGQFLHEILARFFEAWQASGRKAITAVNIDIARAEFVEIVDRRLAALGRPEAALWRARLLGSAARAGIGEAVLRVEAAAADNVAERLIEHRLDGPCRLQAPRKDDAPGSECEGTAGRAEPIQRTVTLRGIADRIDVLDGGRLRIVDYKLGRAPDVRRAVQLPLYAVHASQQFGGTVAGAAYLAFGERQPFVPIASRGVGLNRAIEEGEGRALQAIDGIERGDFPRRPAETFLCSHCPYAGLCRKDYDDGQP